MTWNWYIAPVADVEVVINEETQEKASSPQVMGDGQQFLLGPFRVQMPMGSPAQALIKIPDTTTAPSDWVTVTDFAATFELVMGFPPGPGAE